MTSIKRRNEILTSAGYPSYREYLKSELWSKIRQACFLLKYRAGQSIKSRTAGKTTKRARRGRRAMAENVAYQEKMLAKHRW